MTAGGEGVKRPGPAGARSRWSAAPAATGGGETGETDGAGRAGPPREAVVALRHVSKWYGAVVAVSDLSFELWPGVTGLLGPNGAGKTTTLKAICGLVHPSQGEVRVFGRPLASDPALYRAIGVVPDGDRLYPRLTVRSYVRLQAELQGLADAGAAAERALAEVGLTELAERRLKGLSKGERQRAKVAGAIVHQPALLVLDEPMTGMDPGQRAHFIELVRLIGSAGVTVLVSSHILAEVERLASQVLVLVGGRLAAAGDFHAIRDLMADQPRTVMVRASDARQLASGLISLPTTVAVEVDGEALRARTRSVEAFATALPRLARDAGVSLREIRTTDESLEQVFHYLVGRR